MAGSNYVRISSSIGDIMRIANGLRSQGNSLNQKLKPVIDRITEMEADRTDTFPPDDYTGNFLDKYCAPVTASDGTSVDTNEAVKKSALGIGDGLIGMGDFVVGAMWNYQGQDDENATTIKNTSV